MALQCDPVVLSSLSAGEISQQLPYEFPFGTNLTPCPPEPNTSSNWQRFLNNQSLLNIQDNSNDWAVGKFICLRMHIYLLHC